MGCSDLSNGLWTPILSIALRQLLIPAYLQGQHDAWPSSVPNCSSSEVDGSSKEPHQDLREPPNKSHSDAYDNLRRFWAERTKPVTYPASTAVMYASQHECCPSALRRGLADETVDDTRLAHFGCAIATHILHWSVLLPSGMCSCTELCMRRTWRPCVELLSYGYDARRRSSVSGFVPHHPEHATSAEKVRLLLRPTSCILYILIVALL